MLLRRSTPFALCVLFALACSDKDKATTPTDVMAALKDLPGQVLAPLPQAPSIDVAPESLPGAGQDLAVVVARPQGEVQGEVRPTVTFSRPVKSLEMVEAQRASDASKPFAKIEPAIEGEWRWLGSASAEFVPKGIVPSSTAFKVTVFKGLTAIDGATLPKEYEFSFTTPVLELQEISPARDFAWLKPDQRVSLLVNQSIEPAALVAAVTFHVEGKAEPIKSQLISTVSIQDERRQEAEKAGQRYRPMNEGDRGFRNKQMRYTVAPEISLPLGKKVTLKFDPSLHGAEGALQGKPFAAVNYQTYGAFKLVAARFCTEGCAYGPLNIETTNEADPESFKGKGKIKITPEVEIDAESISSWAPHSPWEMGQKPRLTIAGKFKPGTTYSIEIAKGGSDVFKQASGDDFKATAASNDLNPSLIVGGGLGLIEAGKESPKVPIEVANIKTLNVQLWKLSVPELVTALSGQNAESKGIARAPDVSEDQTLKYAKNHARVHPIELSKVFGDSKTGVAMINVNSPDLQYKSNGYRQLVQATDLAAHIKIAPKKSLVWLTRLSNGEPVSGADITVYDETSAPLWSGKTNDDGFADVPGAVEMKLKSPKYEWQAPFALVVAQKDGDLSATANTWSSGVEPYEFNLSQGWEGEVPSAASYAFTDRGIYRPGDTVYVKGIVRYRVVGALKAPSEGSAMKLVVSDPRSNKLKEETVKVTKYGTFATSLVIPKDAALGFFSVSAEGAVGSGSVRISTEFRVEEYRAPQFRVDVETAKKSLVAGDALEASIFARYLFGGAMANAGTKWSVQRSSTVFSPDSAREFTFAQETWWWDDNAPASADGFFASGDGVVNEKGELKVKAGATEAPGGKPYTYTFEAEVTDVNRQAVAGRTEIMVHPSAAYIGLKANTSFMQVGTEYPIDALVVDPEGARVKGRPFEVTVTSRVWKSVKKKDATGGFTTVSEPVETEVSKCALTSGDSSVPCKFTPKTAGFFIVRGTVKDDGGRVHSSSMGLYATGSDWVAWQRNDTDRIELIADKTKYGVGDVAKVLIKSPYPEARAMVTVEREGVFERRLVNLKGSVVTIEVPITEEMVPNMFVGVLIMRPRVSNGGIETGDDPGRPNARIGLVKLDVEMKTKRLSVAVKTDKAEYQPRQTMNIELSVKDSTGKPANGEATVFVVDEAVLRLTAYVTPDPIDSIFRQRPLSTRLGEPLLHLVRERSYGEKGEAQGGGGGKEGAGFRSNFKTTALWLPNLEVKDGVAKTTVVLPDNLTTFRVMAVVVTTGERFGSGESPALVNKPVMALPAMPRFARVGDVFEAGVVVHSHGAGAGEVTVTATVEGGAELTGAASQKAMVGEGAPKEIRFGFKAVKPGLTTFRFKAVNGANDDGVEEKLPIELPVEIDAIATSGDTRDSRVEGVVAPKDVYEDLGGLTVTLASTSMGNFGAGMQQLIEYPYGCLEQQSSRLVPFIALREIAGQFGVAWPARNAKKAEHDDEFNALLNTYLFPTLDVSQKKNPDDVIDATVKSIVALQDSNGSFRYWPDSFCSSSWASAYATLALVRAKEVGFVVSPEVVGKAAGYLGNVVGGKCNPCERECTDETRVFASYVLARMKKPKASSYSEFYARRDKLSLFGRAALANAMFVGGGDRKKANALLQEILNNAKESTKGVHLEEVKSGSYATYFHSDTRTTGMVLQALTDISPDHPFVGKMAQYLTSVRQGDGQWRSTQEAAFSLLALTEVMRTKEKDVPDFTASVALGAQELIKLPFQGRSMNVQAKTVPMSKIAGTADGKLSFSKEGTGVLYYTALLRYAPKTMPTKALDQGLFVQRWFEPFAGGGQSLKFFAGDLVRIRLRTASNQERHWVAFEVPLPAGLEPVNTSLSTTASLGSSPNEESRGIDSEGEGEGEYEDGEAEEPSSPYSYGFWSPFTHTEMRDNRVIVFADHLPPGVHVTSFVARATTPGTYILKPAKGTLMYEPETWGRSEGGTFEVALPTTVTQK